MASWGEPGRGYPRSRPRGHRRDSLLSALVAIPLGVGIAYAIRWTVRALIGV